MRSEQIADNSEQITVVNRINPLFLCYLLLIICYLYSLTSN